jgi:hypothetical protein
MKLSRRRAAVAGLTTLVGISFLHASYAQGGDEAAVNQAVDDLRIAMIAADQTSLEALVADQLSYGHSGGVIESKAQFVNVIVSKKTIYKSITLSEPSATVVGNNAIARHIFSTEFEADGKPGTSRVGVLQVWTKQDGRWRLLARQAFRLPT